MIVKTLVCENCKEESQLENGKCPICEENSESSKVEYLDFNVYPTREKEENWSIRDDVENVFDWDEEQIHGLKWFCSEVDMVVRLYKDGSTKLLEINGIDVSDKNISV